MAVLHREYYKGTGKGQAKIQVNQDIRAYIEETPEGDYSHILAEDERWEVFYHLSDMRESVLNWYEWGQDASILEVGGEFGALTGLFCRRANHVTTVEYGLFKAEAICKRYEKLENLDVYAGNLLDMRFEERFDYIVMIGCLERQCGGTKVSGEYVNYLKRVAGLLKPDGRLLMAVENRYGLRYFCGEAEPYTGKPYAGINHYPQAAKGYTFSRQELSDILHGTGFQSVKFFYPLPDYKLTQMIYSDAYLPRKDLGERLLFYHRTPQFMLALEQNLYGELIENQVFPFFANSFLTECSLNGECSPAIYAAVTTDRGKEYGLSTCIHEQFGDDGQKKSAIVKKKALYQEGRGSIDNVYANIMALQERGISVVPHEQKEDAVIMPFVPEITCSDYLRKLAAAGDRKSFEAIFEMLYQNILESSETVPAGENRFPGAGESSLDFGPILKNCYVDMIPFNCFYKNGRLLYFDQEFAREHYPAAYPMYRAIWYTYVFVPEAEQIIPLQEMKERYHLTHLWDVFQKEEERFVAANRRYDVYRSFYRWTAMDSQVTEKNAEHLFGQKAYKVGYVAGVFDLFHVGHLNLIKKAKKKCEYLIVGVLTDELVVHFKSQKPYIPYEERLAIIAALKEVDKAVGVTMDNIDKMAAWNLYQFDCLFSGDDYINHESWIRDKERLNRVGSDIQFFPYTKSTSSTQIKEAMRSAAER